MTSPRIFWLAKGILLVSLGAAALPAGASETISYTYDVKGRVVQVVRTGTVNNGVTTTYLYDKANNRRQVTTTGAAR